MTTTPSNHFDRLDAAPVLLLPVRLETRYVGGPSAPTELRIRVYPEQVHLDAHDERLTPGELRAGKTYWRHRRRPRTGGDDPAASAWAELIRGVRPQRAAWVVEATTPTNETGEPEFPPVRTRPASADLPMRVRGLPRRWVALGYDAAGTVVLRRWFDHPVQERLLATAVLDEGDDLDGDRAVNAYLGWAAHYGEAVAAGMAVTVRPEDLAEGTTLAQGLHRVVVCGVDTAATAAEGAAELETLLTAHAYSDGLGYLPPGTPTNDTASRATTAEGTAAAGTGPPVADPAARKPRIDPAWSAAGRLQTALGLRSGGAVERPPGAADRSARVTADLVGATWSATLGYFTDQLLQPVVGPSALADTRRHAVEHLQPLGPLPTLRVGRQPLGLLPVVPPGPPVGGPDGTPPGGDPFAARLGDLLARLRPAWERSVAQVPRLLDSGSGGPGSDDPAELEAVLLAILQRSPWTTRVWYRRVFGPLVGLATGGLGRAQLLQAALRTIGFLDALGATVQPRVVGLGLQPRTEHVRIPFVGRGTPPDTGYLAEVRAAVHNHDGREQLSQRGTPGSLLEALVTFAGLQEIDAAAARLGGPFLPGDRRPPSWRTPELSEIADVGEPSPRVLATTPRPELGGRSLAEEVAHRLDTAPKDRTLGDLRGFLESLTGLEGAASEAIDVALRALLGACSHRLDAWVTSLATRRLTAVRDTRPSGVHLGGYGVVEALHPEQSPDSQGYVLAPSLAHATTAAVLRSGYLAQRGAGEGGLDVDLSSTRVQTALQLMRGVRAGVTLPVLLGYRLERSLRDDDLSVLILPTRQAFPLRTPDPAPTGPAEAIPPRDVVEAAALLGLWTAGAAGRQSVLERVAEQAGRPTGDPLLARFADHVDALADTFDAVADVVLAETVHQVVAGHPERAQAAAAFLDRQEVPVDPDVTATPRRSSGHAQRCAVVLDGVVPAAWRGLAARDPWAAAEPRVDAWCARLVGDPGQWRFVVVARSRGGRIRERTAVGLTELGLGALRLVVAATTRSVDGPTELEERILRQAAERLSPPAGGRLEVRPASGAGLGLAELAALAAAVRRVLTAARPATADIFAAPDSDAPGRLDVGDLRDRAAAAEERLRTAVAALAEALADGAGDARLARRLDAAGDAGLPSALPPVGRPLADHARDVLVTGRSRVAALDRLAPADERASYHRARITTVFGDAFPVLGAFPVPEEVRESLRARAQRILLGGDPRAAVTWVTRLARVRPPVDALWHLLVGAEATTGYAADRFGVVQLPQRDGAVWAALTTPDPPPEVAVALHLTSGAALPGRIAALRIDAWSELVPRARETAGVAFHYDAPSNRAPQVALLAVPPHDGEAPWQLDLLAGTVLEALDLARLRGVTLHDLPALGAVLPALYVPMDVTGNVPSLDVDRLAVVEGPDQLVLGRD